MYGDDLSNPRIFLIPPNYSIWDKSPFYHIQRLSHDRLLAFNQAGDNLIFFGNGGVLELGDSVCCHHPHPLSQDGRWLITLMVRPDNRDNTFRVWDIFNEQIILEFSISFGYRAIIYQDYGFLVLGMGERSGIPHEFHQIAYSYESGTVVELPDTADGRFIEILPDNRLLYEQTESYQDKSKGIYLYEPENDEYTLLISGGEQIPQFEH